MAKTNNAAKISTELVQRFQSGDEAAFTELYELYKNPALRSAFLLTGNYCDSENVLQETFLKCYQNLPRLKEPNSFKAWFYRILTRTAWEYCHKRDRETPTANIRWEAADAPDPADEAFARLAAAEMLAAVDKLPLKQKTVIILYYYDELSVQEIAQVTGTFAGTVKSRLFTARQNLQRLLKKTLPEDLEQVMDWEVKKNELRTQV